MEMMLALVSLATKLETQTNTGIDIS